MSRIILVRHGQAEAGWNAELDPGLSELGRRQAASAAEALATMTPCALVTSPMRRARETARPLEEAWQASARIVDDVGEILSPIEALEGRGAWLARVMAGSWDEQEPDVRAWRQRVLDWLAACDQDTVTFSHFIAINVAVGEATGDRRVMCFRPDNTSRTVLDVVDGRLHLVELGAEAVTVVQ